MFDIDKELKSLSIKNAGPSEELRQQTRRLCAEAAESKTHKKTKSKKILWAAPALVAVVTTVLILFAILPAGIVQPEVVGYYTVDINPSLCFEVDENDIILSVKPENDDAAALLSDLKLNGLAFKNALTTVVRTATEMSYLKDEGHLLVAYFGDQNGITQQEVEKIVGKATDEPVNVLLMEADIQRYEQAKQKKQQAGIQLLLDEAEDMGIECDNIDDIICSIQEKTQEKTQEKAQAKQNTKQNNGNNNKNEEKKQNQQSSQGNSQGNNQNAGQNHGHDNESADDDDDRDNDWDDDEMDIKDSDDANWNDDDDNGQPSSDKGNKDKDKKDNGKNNGKNDGNTEYQDDDDDNDDRDDDDDDDWDDDDDDDWDDDDDDWDDDDDDWDDDDDDD